MMKVLRLALLVALGASSSACFQFDTLVRLNPDGSGTIEQRVLFTAAAIEQLKQLAGVAGGSPDATPFNPLSEDSARDIANQLGPSVTYVSSTPVHTAEGDGRDIVFAFDDIRAVRMSQQPPGADAFTGNTQALGFTLTQTPGGTTLLQISMPGDAGTGAAGGTGIPDFPPAAQMAMLKPLLAGARIAIAIEPAGRLLRTNSPYVDGNRVTLLELDLDQLLADETLLARIQAAPDRAAAQGVIENVPGVKFVSAPEITIEFAP